MRLIMRVDEIDYEQRNDKKQEYIREDTMIDQSASSFHVTLRAIWWIHFLLIVSFIRQPTGKVTLVADSATKQESITGYGNDI